MRAVTSAAAQSTGCRELGPIMARDIVGTAVSKAEQQQGLSRILR